MLLQSPIPLSLYIHIPWCVKKCPYCDFNSHVSATLPENQYVDALLEDLEQELPRVWGRRLTSVFIGGGTPSLFSPHAIDKLLLGIRARMTLPPDTEITLEANPGTLEYNRFAEFRAAGVTRVSIGVQSFQDEKLARLGRIHQAQHAIAAIEAAHTAGFKSFNIDLMYGLPGQTLEDALYDVNTAVALSPPHLSWYHLTIEPNTVFYSQPPKQLPNDDHIVEIETACRAQLSSHGLQAYEISAYSQPQHQCQHNRNYWEFGDYIGIGAGAHGKISLPQENKIIRTRKKRIPTSYLDPQTPFLAEEITLTAADLCFEFMLNALRLTEGVEAHLFPQYTGLPLTAIQAPLQRAQALGLMTNTPNRLQPTVKGQQFLNDLVALFIA